MYFEDVRTLEELRKEYRRLVKENHPDNGGSEETIKTINIEYERLFKVLEMNDMEQTENKYNMEFDEQFRDIINKIINFDISIEICGMWIWVSGNTFECKTELKMFGFRWASKKKMWYWHNPEEQLKGYGKTTMSDIRMKYGSQIVKERKVVCIA